MCAFISLSPRTRLVIVFSFCLSQTSLWTCTEPDHDVCLCARQQTPARGARFFSSLPQSIDARRSAPRRVRIPAGRIKVDPTGSLHHTRVCARRDGINIITPWLLLCIIILLRASERCDLNKTYIGILLARTAFRPRTVFRRRIL